MFGQDNSTCFKIRADELFYNTLRESNRYKNLDTDRTTSIEHQTECGLISIEMLPFPIKHS